MENKLEIQLGEYKIVAEVNDLNTPDIPPELNVYLVDKHGCITQDICLVRPHHSLNRETMQWTTRNDFVDCLVWGESGDEDYTDRHVIAVYEEEEE